MYQPCNYMYFTYLYKLAETICDMAEAFCDILVFILRLTTFAVNLGDRST
jgi:hypothetical protein